MATASEHHLGHERWLEEWTPEDRAKEFAVRSWKAESCPQCGTHPSMWSPNHGGDIRHPDVVPVWRFCHICAQTERMREAGPPGQPKRADGAPAPGYYIQIVPAEEASRER